MSAPPEEEYTVIVEGIAGLIEFDAAARVEFSCGDPLQTQSFGPFQMTAAPFTSGMWTAFTFNPMGCTVSAVNESAELARFAAFTCEDCGRFEFNNGCPGRFSCDRLSEKCYAPCLENGQCPEGYRCERTGTLQVSPYCVPMNGCE